MAVMFNTNVPKFELLIVCLCGTLVPHSNSDTFLKTVQEPYKQRSMVDHRCQSKKKTKKNNKIKIK